MSFVSCFQEVDVFYFLPLPHQTSLSQFYDNPPVTKNIYIKKKKKKTNKQTKPHANVINDISTSER